ncbi:hypothetical protein [Speluncibacter jeojiensis]|uniref:Uncharacterized protein n=1 Tax=Speluncibacter jeojiensis TaxID=2710754 RepID=A0A9X4LY59_9ACTN|nr:hypothetical protein [Rhodococcus sp. D2-41]MDG3014520.1 hypothetical protein [Corynebacteriales bacterium D3-21]
MSSEIDWNTIIEKIIGILAGAAPGGGTGTGGDGTGGTSGT